MKNKRFTKDEDDILIKLHWHYGRKWASYVQDYMPGRNLQSIHNRMCVLRKRYHWQY